MVTILRENSVNLAAFDELIGSFGCFKVNNFGFRAFVANYNGGKLSPKSMGQARKVFFKRDMFYKFQKKSNSLILFLLFSTLSIFRCRQLKVRREEKQ